MHHTPVMTHIFERVLVRCPYTVARRYVHEDAVHAIPPVPPYTLHLEHAEDQLRFDERLRVEWEPKEGAPLPHFLGELVLRALPEMHESMLELSGDYIPPLGAPGRAFDLFIGQKLAMATAKSVLHKMAHDIEEHADKNVL